MEFLEIFLDGEIAIVSPSDLESLNPGKLKGRGVFETMLVKDGKVFFLNEHLARLAQGLETLKIKSSFRKNDLGLAIEQVLKIHRSKNARLRLTVWRFKNKVHCSVIVQPYQIPSEISFRRGFKAIIFPKEYNEHSPNAGIKSIDYGFFSKAGAYARKKGYDEAIVVNQKGHLVEGNRSNLFLVKNGILCTPSRSCGCLNGITRQAVLKIARRMRLKTKEINAAPKELLEAQEIFVTNSLLGIMPVTFLDSYSIRCGCIGPVTEKIWKEYARILKK